MVGEITAVAGSIGGELVLCAAPGVAVAVSVVAVVVRSIAEAAAAVAVVVAVVVAMVGAVVLGVIGAGVGGSVLPHLGLGLSVDTEEGGAAERAEGESALRLAIDTAVTDSTITANSTPMHSAPMATNIPGKPRPRDRGSMPLPEGTTLGMSSGIPSVYGCGWVGVPSLDLSGIDGQHGDE